jgi:hypothetical protein
MASCDAKIAVADVRWAFFEIFTTRSIVDERPLFTARLVARDDEILVVA